MPNTFSAMCSWRPHRTLRAPAALVPFLFAAVAPLVLAGCGTDVGPDDAIVVIDSAGTEIVRNLRRPDTITVEGPPTLRIGETDGAQEYTFGGIRDLDVLADGSVVVADRFGRIALFDRDGRWIRDVGSVNTIIGPYPVPEYGWDIVDSRTGRGQMVMPPALSVYPPWTTTGDTILLADPVEPVIRFYREDGSLFRELRLTGSVAPPSRELREEYFERVALTFPNVDLDRVRAETRFVDVAPTIADIRYDDRGRLWVAALGGLRLDGVGNVWDVVAPDGRQLLAIRFPRNFRLVRVRGDRAYGITTKSEGVTVVEAYDLPSVGER